MALVRLTFSQRLYSKYLLFKIKIKENFKLDLLLIGCIIFFIFFLFEKYLSEKQLEEKNFVLSKAITNNIALQIQTIENEIDKTLIAASILVQEKMLHNPKFSEKDLKDLSKELKIGSIGILNGKDGKYVMTSSDNFDKKNPFYKELSLKDINQCATQKCNGKLCRLAHEIINCKIKRTEVLRAIQNPEIPVLLPMFRVTLHSANPIKAPAKWIVVYNKKLDKIIDIFYSKEELDSILNDILKIHNNFLLSANLEDGNRNVIIKSENSLYSGTKIKSPIQKEWIFNIDGEEVVYSYVVSAEFSNKKLNYEIWVSRILFTIIAITLTTIILMLKIKVNQKNKGIAFLKKALRRKP
jgi:hypothetical protein